VFDPTVYPIVAGPDPLAVPLTATHELSAVTVHAQPAAIESPTDPLPPSAP
jgi:hypothetical protein